jgi:hypothetical protein
MASSPTAKKRTQQEQTDKPLGIGVPSEGHPT